MPGIRFKGIREIRFKEEDVRIKVRYIKGSIRINGRMKGRLRLCLWRETVGVEGDGMEELRGENMPEIKYGQTQYIRSVSSNIYWI